MTLRGDRKREYDREWERHSRKARRGDRHLSPVKIGRFVSFDGEGYDEPDGSHSYVLLQDSMGGVIESPGGLSSQQCLRFISEARKRVGGRLCGVSFAFDYDVNNIIRDLPWDKLERLWKHGEVKWSCWRLEWRPRKWFQVSLLDRVSNRPIKGSTVRVYDIYGFFQSGFVPACEDWLGKKDPDLKIVRKGKRLRRSFQPSDLPFMREYNAAELRLMVRLVTALRAAFDEAKIPLTQFYGAGAAATAFLTKIEARNYIDHMEPPAVEQAGRHGYFGGRIEVPVYGNVPGPIYRYDVNSAHPSALAELPNLRAGHWVRGKLFRSDLPFSVYHVSWRFPRGCPFYPFPWRSPEGAIYFPPTGKAWLWQPEIAAALECGGFSKRAILFLDAWHFVPDDPTERPFSQVREAYALRQRLKSEGKPAQKAIKLCLNSLYGKFAQSVSSAGRFGCEDGHARKPTFHQIEYAGYVSSATRAKVYRAACQRPGAILAFATDGILSTEPLVLPVSKELGEWSREEFKAATIVQSGVYRLFKDDGQWVAYGRGYADKDLPWGRIDRAWRAGKRELTALSRRKRFIGLGATLQSKDWSLWRRFIPLPRDVQLAAVGKRSDLHPPPTWTPEDNPATRPHLTEPYDPVVMEGYDPESIPWRPKWEDPRAGTVEDWELTAEAARLEGEATRKIGGESLRRGRLPCYRS